jgi:hypothetical protein
MLLLGLTLKTIGEVLLGLTVILVHHQIVTDHTIDKKVLNIMHREQFLAGLGILFIVVGFIFETIFYL